MKNGATRAKIISTAKIVIDRRVRMKCLVPRCSNYGRHLMCPPDLMSIDEFQKVVRLYKKALLVQIESDIDSTDKSGKPLSGALVRELERGAGKDKHELRLHRLVNHMESIAFKRGMYLAAGFIASECELCSDCASKNGTTRCRRPFEARPSMQAMGIDVIMTCEEAGMPIRLSSKNRVRWTGLVLLK